MVFITLETTHAASKIEPMPLVRDSLFLIETVFERGAPFPVFLNAVFSLV